MKRPSVVLVAVLLSVVALVPGLSAEAAPPAPTRLVHLDPGGPAGLRETVPVNVVLVGYGRADVDRAALRSALPRGGEPVVRSRLWYGIEDAVGISYRYDYRFVDARKGYEDRFFRFLSSQAEKAPVTDFQRDYNDQAGNARIVTSNVEISAPAVERWLAAHPPAGVDTRRNTVFLVNWFGRKDFRFHVYTKQDEPDPDTGYNFGRERQSRRVVAWGGTTARDEEDGSGRTSRVWFHDISAGPESWAGSWNIDDADLDGDGVPDYRIPVIWEYGHYRPRSALAADLARLVRYVAVDLLFTPSPIYPAELPVGEPARTVDLDSNTYEGWPGVDASSTYITPSLLRRELQEVTPLQRLSYDNQDLPYAGQAKACWEGYLTDVACYPGSPAYVNLFLQNTADLARTKDDGDTVDYELPIFNYATTGASPFLGLADDNYVDGTQSYVYTSVTPEVVEAGYGLTTSIIHEVGHHLGLSHPHDGYDPTGRTDFEPTGDTFFAWAGDESNSMMSYIDLNWDFSQFDQDNLHRFQAAALLEAANRQAAAALAGPHPERARAALLAADRAAGRAQQDLAQHRYLATLQTSAVAYGLARAAAYAAGVDADALERSARQQRRAPRGGPADPAVVDPLQGPRADG